MPTTEISSTDRLTILKLLADAQSPEFVEQATGIKSDQVLRIASEHGYPDRHKLAWAADLVQQQIDQAERKAITSSPAPTSPSTTPKRPHAQRPPEQPAHRTSVARPAPAAAERDQTTTSDPAPDSVRGLIARGAKSERVRTQRLATKATATVDALERALQAEEDARRAAAEVARAKARERAERAAQERRIRAERAELERRREALRRQLRPGRSSRPAPAPRDIDPKKVRQWARASGVAVPAMGTVPVRVVEQYLAASTKAA